MVQIKSLKSTIPSLSSFKGQVEDEKPNIILAISPGYGYRAIHYR
jgi:hypothetical protein